MPRVVACVTHLTPLHPYQINSTTEKVIALVRRRLNRACAIHRLPPEVLSTIFSLVARFRSDQEEEEISSNFTEKKQAAGKNDGKRNDERIRRQGLKPPRTLETTMFERLEKMYGPGIKHMLTVQYR